MDLQSIYESLRASRSKVQAAKEALFGKDHMTALIELNAVLAEVSSAEKAAAGMLGIRPTAANPMLYLTTNL